MNTIELTGRATTPFDSEYMNYEIRLPEIEDFNEWDIQSLINLIVRQYHINARKDVVVIYELAQKAFCSQSEKHPELVKLVEALFLFFDDLLFHLKKEEQILFSSIIHLNEKKLHEGAFDYSTFGIIREYAEKMQNEHEDLIGQLKMIRELTNDYRPPAGGSMECKSLFLKMEQFESEMIQHIQLENDVLLPRAIQMDKS